MHSHLRWPSPPGLVPEGDTSKAFSFGHSILSGDLVLPWSHSRGFMLQLGKMLHTAVHLHVHTTRESTFWTLTALFWEPMNNHFHFKASNIFIHTTVRSDLAKARGAGWEAMNLHRLIIIGIIFIIWLHMMVALRPSWWGKVMRLLKKGHKLRE